MKKIASVIQSALASLRKGHSDLTLTQMTIADISTPARALPIIGKFPTHVQQRIAFVGAGSAFAIAVALFGAGAYNQFKMDRTGEFLAAIRLNVQDAEILARLAHEGDEAILNQGEESLKTLSKNIDSLGGTLAIFDRGSINDDIRALSGKLTSEFATVTEKKTSLVKFSSAVNESREALTAAMDHLNQVVAIDRNAGTSDNSPVYAAMQESTARAIDIIGRFAAGEKNTETQLAILNNDIGAATRLAHYLITGAPGVKVTAPRPAEKELLTKALDLIQKVGLLENELSSGAASFSTAARLAPELGSMAVELKKAVEARATSVSDSNSTAIFYSLGGLLALLGAAFVAIMQSIHAREARDFAIKTKTEAQETDAAIMTLMNDMKDLSQGDLTKRIPMTEHFIGSVGERINMVAEQLEDAIRGVKTSAAETQRLVDGIETKITQAMPQFEDAAFAAVESRGVAEMGASTVTDAAEKMKQTRERMQDVSKRVKRLGEVSQAISSIVETIQEVTERTNILALTTNLKAAQAGEEGQAFQVIANEINDLSTKASRALVDITQNVRTIQGETQSVLTTVEQATQGIVEGSSLWEEARIALDNMTGSATMIEQTVRTLRDVATNQTEIAANASKQMTELARSVNQFVTAEAA